MNLGGPFQPKLFCDSVCSEYAKVELNYCFVDCQGFLAFVC